MLCGAVRCCAVLCGAVRCCAVLCRRRAATDPKNKMAPEGQGHHPHPHGASVLRRAANAKRATLSTLPARLAHRGTAAARAGALAASRARIGAAAVGVGPRPVGPHGAPSRLRPAWRETREKPRRGVAWRRILACAWAAGRAAHLSAAATACDGPRRCQRPSEQRRQGPSSRRPEDMCERRLLAGLSSWRPEVPRWTWPLCRASFVDDVLEDDCTRPKAHAPLLRPRSLVLRVLWLPCRLALPWP